MAQAGTIVVCGDAGLGLGDSLYEAVIYVRGKIEGLGADAREEPMGDTDRKTVKDLLTRAGIDHDAAEFKRVASARGLYYWNAANHEAY
jgi:glutamate synthase domain-containing protein 3